MDLLNQNLQSVKFNHYNLEIYISIAQLFRQNLQMIKALHHVDSLLNAAEHSAQTANARRAIASIDRALDTVKQIRMERNQVLHDTTALWEQSWLPRVAEANGRKYLLEVDEREGLSALQDCGHELSDLSRAPVAPGRMV